jgi:hypothetical protein
VTKTFSLPSGEILPKYITPFGAPGCDLSQAASSRIRRRSIVCLCSSAYAAIHPFGCHNGCHMRFTLAALFLAKLISTGNIKAFNESPLMCVSPSHLNSLVVLAHSINESETVPTSFPRSGTFLSRKRATCVHLIRGESLIKRWNERV